MRLRRCAELASSYAAHTVDNRRLAPHNGSSANHSSFPRTLMTRLTSLLLLLLTSEILAADWPAWRGPTGQGFCEEKNIPVTWNDKEGVKWKVPLANQGNSTPV